MIWSKEEKYTRTEIENIQWERLKKQIHYAYESLAPYRKKMEEQKIRPEDIKTLKDIHKLPFVVKDDFRKEYPFGMFAVPRKAVRRIHASSGTTGKPTVVGYTKEDLKNWSEQVARIAAMGGATEEDTAQIAFGYGMFTGALGLHYGLEHIGADVIPVSSGNTEKQLLFLRDFETTVLVATPSYALYIAERMEENGYQKKDFRLRFGLVGGEALSEKMRVELEERWEADFTQNYGMSELNGPGVSGECLMKNGMHINEDHFYAEIIDPETLEVLDEGEEGELVITCLTKEAIPLLRYRTGDITRLTKEPCDCGRNFLRMAPLHGRTDDMLVIRGVNLFPSQIETALENFDEIGAHYEIEVRRVNHLDVMTIKVELIDFKLLDSFGELERVKKEIKQKIRSVTGLDSQIRLLAPRSLERFEGKARRVKDFRE
ncbi:MAG: phenylacetate--CoA ligase [Tissierellia bacterium]|nr:phenylacetate--CoA ligase [Tissierellia bacterium]